MSDDPWGAGQASTAPEGWIPTPENGWGALVAWAAGPLNMVRVPAAPRNRETVVVTQYSDGRVTREPSLLTDADLESIDDDIDSYLAEAGLPPRPRGFDWYLRPPAAAAGGPDAFWAAVWEGATAGLPNDGMHPSRLRVATAATMARLYRR
jgi:hypothetical protein